MKNIWVPVSGAIAQQRKVETIANNVANAVTPGFKREDLSFREYLTVLNKGAEDIHLPHQEWRPEDFYKSYGAENAMVQVDGSYTDFTQGQLNPTGNPLDIALQGPGLLEILTPNGIRYTRRGTFSLDQEGHLINELGYAVLAPKDPSLDVSEGQPQQIDEPNKRKIQVGTGPLVINPNGEIVQGEQVVGKLSIQEFKDLHGLVKEGGGLFINPHPDNKKMAPDTTQVHQGFIEESNVNAVAEMSELIKANRHFEAIQRAIKAYDNIAGKGVNEISRF